MLSQEKQEIFARIKEINPNANEKNYIGVSKDVMLSILTKMQNNREKYPNSKTNKETTKNKLKIKTNDVEVELVPDYETDESIEIKTDKDKGLEIFNKDRTQKSFDIDEKTEKKDENAQTSLFENTEYPKDVKDIPNLNKWFRDNIDKETNKDWQERLKDAYTCNQGVIFKGSPLKRKREIVQQYLDYKNKITESKKSDNLYYAIYNHAKKIIELNPNIEPSKLNMENTYMTNDLETIRTYNEVLRKIDSTTKYLDTDVKLGVITEEQAKLKRDIADIMTRYINIRKDTIKDLFTESRHKVEEVSRNELLVKAKGETITRYNKAAGYKGFYIENIDTTNLFRDNTLLVTCRVGKYDDTIQLEDVLYWIQIVAEMNKDRQINTKGVTQALMNSIDGMDIKVDCTCMDWCLEENTKIKLLNGHVVSVKDMKTKFDNNEELWVYATDENGDFRPGKVEDVWISGYSKDMIKVTLDNGKEILTTPNHKYMMRDGSYKEAQELKCSDSLMPLYFKYENEQEIVELNSANNSKCFSVKEIEKIHYDEPIPVYDINVKDYHNFYVDAGVMLHNCCRFAYNASVWGYKYGKPETRPAKIRNPDGFGAICKHLISMLSNKKWLQQVTGTLMDYIVKNIDDVNTFLKLKDDKVLTLPNELARYNAKTANYGKLFKKDDEDEEEQDNQEEQENQNKQDNDYEELEDIDKKDDNENLKDEEEN